MKKYRNHARAVLVTLATLDGLWPIQSSRGGLETRTLYTKDGDRQINY